VEGYPYHDGYVSVKNTVTLPERSMDMPLMPSAPTATGSPSTTSKWFEFMRGEREASDRRLERMFEHMNVETSLGMTSIKLHPRFSQ
jgi:hypothetical protein